MERYKEMQGRLLIWVSGRAHSARSVGRLPAHPVDQGERWVLPASEGTEAAATRRVPHAGFQEAPRKPAHRQEEKLWAVCLPWLWLSFNVIRSSAWKWDIKGRLQLLKMCVPGDEGVGWKVSSACFSHVDQSNICDSGNWRWWQAKLSWDSPGRE